MLHNANIWSIVCENNDDIKPLFRRSMVGYLVIALAIFKNLDCFSVKKKM